MSRNRRMPERAGGYSESVVPYTAWMNLKEGDVVVMRRSGRRRVVIGVSYGYVELSKIKLGKFPNNPNTLYGPGDRHYFILPNYRYSQFSLKDFCPYL